MSTSLATDPPEPAGPDVHAGPDLRRIRYRRDGGTAWRVFRGGDLLGRIEQRRVVITPRTGRKANRWFYTPAGLAWRDQPVPPAAHTGTEIGPHQGNGRPDAARLLVDHLNRHGCPVVADLYPRET